MLGKTANRKKKLLRQKRIKLQEQEAMRKRRERLINTESRKTKFVEYHPVSTRYIRNSNNKDIPSKELPPPVDFKRIPRYTDEMLEREQKAQEEIERKKKRLAPHYSKGPYQYITDDTPLEDLGRKK